MKMLKIEIIDLETGEKLVEEETDCIIGAYHSMEEQDREKQDEGTSVKSIALTRARLSTIYNVGKGATNVIEEIIKKSLNDAVEELFGNE